MRFLAYAALLLLASCATVPEQRSSRQFFDRLSALCGQAFVGRIVSPAVPVDTSFAGKRLVMHVRTCSADEIRVPFHVGEDRSRTWVVSRRGSRLRLKHDHRHEDGSEDAVTQYGGDSAPGRSADRQSFPADAFTRDLLLRNNNAPGVNNIWALELRPGELFAYELRRPSRFFRVEFDLSRPIAPPAPPWEAR